MATFTKYAHWPALLAFSGFIFGMAIFGVIEGDDEVSEYERRNLAQFPGISVDRVIDGQFSEDYVVYLQDQAPFRDGFRFLKSAFSRNLFLNAENNGVFVLDGVVYDRFDSINQALIERAARVVGEISNAIDSDRQFVAVIPTKGQALMGSRYLVVDQRQIANRFGDLNRVRPVDLMGLVEMADDGAYYRSDPHWAGDGVMWAYGEIARQLGLERVVGYEYELFSDEYFGSEYGKAAAWAVEPDSIMLPRNGVIDGLSACRYTTFEEKQCVDSVFYRGVESEFDAYDVFLGGLGPLIEITNPAVDTGEELVVFKDSYAHAIAPLLAQHYSKVTLIDLRYVQRNAVFENLELNGKTVLFLYSASVLNTDAQIVN